MPSEYNAFEFRKRLVSKKELKTICGIPYSSPHVSRLEAAGKFPKRIWLGGGRVAWLLSEIEAWIDERVADRNAERRDTEFGPKRQKSLKEKS